jgi:cbb3-type cytochrome oxidase maturation protein
MDILFLLIPLSVVLVFLIGAVFWLALRGGQFDDLESPGLDIVIDDDKTPPSSLQSKAGTVANEVGGKTVELGGDS